MSERPPVVPQDDLLDPVSSRTALPGDGHFQYSHAPTSLCAQKTILNVSQCHWNGFQRSFLPNLTLRLTLDVHRYPCYNHRTSAVLHKLKCILANFGKCVNYLLSRSRYMSAVVTRSTQASFRAHARLLRCHISGCCVCRTPQEHHWCNAILTVPEA